MSKPQRKMQPRPQMPATTPTVPLPVSKTPPSKGPVPMAKSKSFDFQVVDTWINGAKYTPIKKCTHDPTKIIEIAGVSIFVADGWGARSAAVGSVVLNCTGTPKHNAGDDIPPTFAMLRAHLDEPRVTEITLDWPDGGLPPVKASFWRALIEACAAQNVPLVIHCIGGHGRTGTALASILIAYSIPAEDAIEYVREKHCTKAIETLAQERYLEDLDEELNPA